MAEGLRDINAGPGPDLTHASKMAGESIFTEEAAKSSSFSS